MASFRTLFGLSRAPGAPAALTAGLMLAGYTIAATAGMLPVEPPPELTAILLVCVALAWISPADLPDVPTLRPRALAMLRLASLGAVLVELIWFGVPLLGGVPYNEFGWPVVHHIAVMHWMLVLFGRRHKALDLAITVAIAALLFNRQMALFGVLAYLMTTPMKSTRLLLGLVAALALMMLLGALRNRSLDVDTSDFAELSGLAFAGPLFFVYLYLLGPLHIGLGVESAIWDNFLSAYWNTVPEWALLSARFEVHPALSFALFFGACAIVATRLRRCRSPHLQAIGSLIHIYSFFSFFSWVLLSTPVVGNFLQAAAAALLFGWRRGR